MTSTESMQQSINELSETIDKRLEEIETLKAERDEARAAVQLLPADARFQAACAAMQGILAGGYDYFERGFSELTDESLSIADGLLCELAKPTE